MKRAVHFVYRKESQLRFGAAYLASALVLVVLSIFLVKYVAVHFGQEQDISGRYLNLMNLSTTGNIYVPFSVEAFTYPPGAILLFIPITWASATLAPYLWAFFSLAALFGSFVLLLRTSLRGRQVPIVTISLLATIVSAIAFAPILEGLCWGQVGTMLLLLTLTDYLIIKSNRRSGFLIGLATAIKIYPAVFILDFAVRREWRKVANAFVGFLGSTVLAYLVWPTSTWYFFSDVMLKGQELKKFSASTTSQASSSLSAFLTRNSAVVSLNKGEIYLLTAALLSLGLIGAYRLRRQELPDDAFVILSFTSVVISPIAWDHYFEFAILLFFIPFLQPTSRWRKWVSLSVGACFAIPWFRIRSITNDNVPTHVVHILSQNLYFLCALFLLVGAVTTKQHSREVHEIVIQ